MDELYKLLNISDTNLPTQKIIEILKQGKDKTKVFEKAKKELDPHSHDIMNPHLRKAKSKKKDIKDEELNMIALPYQKHIVRKEKAMIFGNQPILNANPEGEEQKTVLKAIERVLHDIKEASFNRKLANSVASMTEGGEIWFVREKEEEHTRYGFTTKMNISVKLLTPKNDEKLYLYKDEFDDLLAFSRSYSKKEEDKTVEYFEVYTSKFIYLFKNGQGWELTNAPIINELGKIPVVFTEQDSTAWAEIQWMIERLEVLLSDHAEVNDRNAYPIIKVKGVLKGYLDRGPGGGVQLDENADMDYLTWNQATESVKLEIENLIKNIQLFTQTPNISFDEVKSMGALSGTALKMLFLDAHLKVMEKREIYDEYLQRRINIIKSILSKLNPSWKKAIDNLIIEPEIVPFMVENEKEQVEIALLKNGNKPLESHEKSVKNWQGQDSEDYEKIKKEEEEASARDYFNPMSVE